jgi:hypothetical protein
MDGVSVVVAAWGGWLTSDVLSFVTGGVVESPEVVDGAVASVGLAAVDDVEEVSCEVPDADVEAPSTAGVEVELTNGGAFSMYEPFGCTA